MNLAALIRTIPDFPKPGIQFKDIESITENPEAFRYVIDQFAEKVRALDIDKLLVLDARSRPSDVVVLASSVFSSVAVVAVLRRRLLRCSLCADSEGATEEPESPLTFTGTLLVASEADGDAETASLPRSFNVHLKSFRVFN